MRTDKEDPIIAIAAADFHLHHIPPIARYGEPDWFTAMARPLNELDNMSAELGVPILFAGDLFHHWKATPELINFALDNLPYMIGIPGQHDLPLHSYADINKSAYATLIKAGKLFNVRPGEPYQIAPRGIPVWIHGFPWGFPVKLPKKKVVAGGAHHIALHHAYRWTPASRAFASTGHQQAPVDQQYNPDEYNGFRTVIIGDNHISWDRDAYRFNCGSLMRRNVDQVDHKPRVGLVHASGRVESRYLDCHLDVMTLVTDSSTLASDGQIARIDGLIEELQGLQSTSLDYPEALRMAMNDKDLSPKARAVLAKALESNGNNK